MFIFFDNKKYNLTKTVNIKFCKNLSRD